MVVAYESLSLKPAINLWPVNVHPVALFFATLVNPRRLENTVNGEGWKVDRGRRNREWEASEIGDRNWGSALRSNPLRVQDSRNRMLGYVCFVSSKQGVVEGQKREAEHSRLRLLCGSSSWALPGGRPLGMTFHGFSYTQCYYWLNCLGCEGLCLRNVTQMPWAASRRHLVMMARVNELMNGDQSRRRASLRITHYLSLKTSPPRASWKDLAISILPPGTRHDVLRTRW